MRYYSGSFTHMQPIEIQHMQSQRTMHVDKPQRPRLGHAKSKLHLISSLTFSSSRISHKLSCSPFPQVHKSEFSPTLHSFLLRKELGSSLESFHWVHGFTHTKRKISLHLISYLTLSKQLQQSGNSLPYGPTPKRKKTLSSSLPLILLGPATRKGKSFHAREILFLFFPSRTINLVRILATLTLESKGRAT